MYCGDETGAFVADCGLSSCRFGYGGEDTPKFVCSSHVKRTSASSSPSSASSEQVPPSSINSGFDDVIPIFSRPPPSDLPTDESSHLRHHTGLITSFDAWESVMEKAFTTLRIHDSTTTPHPMLLTEGFLDGAPTLPPGVSRRQRETVLQTLFEKWDAPAVFLAPAPMLQAFSMGRQTALVFDMGAGGCRATPVVDGLILKTSQRRNGRGGDWLSAVQAEILKRRVLLGSSADRNATTTTTTTTTPEIVDRATLRARAKNLPVPPPESLSRRLALLETMYEMKTGEYVITPAESTIERPTASDQKQEGAATMEEEEEEEEKKTYQLPDGTVVNLNGSEDGKLLCHLPDLFFCRNPAQAARVVSPTAMDASVSATTTPPVHELIKSSISSVDVDVRKELCGNILLCGAHSLFPGLDQRLSSEISGVTSATFKCRVVAPRNSVERRFATWIGGSVLTSLGSFQQLWLSRKEYEEFGGTLSCQRFP